MLGVRNAQGREAFDKRRAQLSKRDRFRAGNMDHRMLFRPAVQHTHQQFGQILLRKEIAQLVGPAFETHGCVPHRLGDESATMDALSP